MRIYGVHYDIGTLTLEGGTTRPTLDEARIEAEIVDIAEALHANAVRVTGGDFERMAATASAAASHGLEVWLTPMLPNSDAAQSLDGIVRAAEIGERLRGSGHACVLMVGCELSAFMQGILPGEDHGERLGLLMDLERLVSETQAQGFDPQERFDSFLRDALEAARSHFGGPVTYGAGLWETVDWSDFDLVGVDAYRDASNHATYSEDLRKRGAQSGKPVVVTEFGCATFRGAGDLGATAWTAVDRTERRLRPGIERDEDEQARELTGQLTAIADAGVDGGFVYTYVAPSYPTASDSPLDPERDLDAASYALVRSWSDGRTERKASFEAMADVFASQAASSDPSGSRSRGG